MKKNNKTIGLALVLVLIGLCVCLAGATYAAYNSLAFQRGVVRNRDSEEIRFTSNLLKTYLPSDNSTAANYNTVLYPFSENTSEDDDLTIQLIIANHLISNEDLVSEKDIVFDLKITINNQQPDVLYTINGEQITNGSITIPDITLNGRKANSKKYTLGFKGKDLNKLTITVEARPTNTSSATLGRRILAANICPCTSSQVNPFSCTGALLKNSEVSPSDYYGYNYEVSISSGKALVTLSWDSTYLKLDPYFLEKLKNRPGNIDGSLKIDDEYDYKRESGSISFIMDQTQAEDDYVITFYPIVEKKEEFISEINNNWDKLSELFSVTADEK